uniref:Uncharacterized protein n=1 Tax=Rhizophora mucronata TaxID=61149 RepID=A0A2P2J223_RHIMU
MLIIDHYFGPNLKKYNISMKNFTKKFLTTS